MLIKELLGNDYGVDRLRELVAERGALLVSLEFEKLFIHRPAERLPRICSGHQ